MNFLVYCNQSFNDLKEIESGYGKEGPCELFGPWYEFQFRTGAGLFLRLPKVFFNTLKDKLDLILN